MDVIDSSVLRGLFPWLPKKNNDLGSGRLNTFSILSVPVVSVQYFERKGERNKTKKNKKKNPFISFVSVRKVGFFFTSRTSAAMASQKTPPKGAANCRR
jgi:hypothetical protein